VKIAFSFLAGIMICSLLLFGVQTVLPLRAETDNLTGTSDNFSLVDLLPDIEKIYHDALITPFEEAGKKIYDDDVAQFYHLLLGKTALRDPPEEP